MNRTILILLLLVAFFSSNIQAQTFIESGNLEEHLATRWHEIHLKLLKQIVSGESRVYHNDTCGTPLTKEYLNERLEFILDGDQIDTSYLNNPKQSGISFFYEHKNSFDEQEVNTKLVALSVMTPYELSGILVLSATTGYIDIRDLKKMLGDEDFNFVMAVQMINQNQKLYEVEQGTTDEYNTRMRFRASQYNEKPKSFVFDTGDFSFTAERMYNCMPFALHNTSEKKGWHTRDLYFDAELTAPIELRTGNIPFTKKLIVQIPNPERPDDPFDFIDTLMVVEVDFLRDDVEMTYLPETKCIKVEFEKATNSKGNKYFYIHEKTLKAILTEWDYILIMDYIHNNTEK